MPLKNHQMWQQALDRLKAECRKRLEDRAYVTRAGYASMALLAIAFMVIQVNHSKEVEQAYVPIPTAELTIYAPERVTAPAKPVVAVVTEKPSIIRATRLADKPARTQKPIRKAVLIHDTGAPGENIGSGHASYYGGGFAGNRTANGEKFDPNEYTAAHPTLPFGSRVRVTNLRTGKSIVVRINDRGPYHGNRVIDLSRSAAEHIGILRHGTAMVELEVLRGLKSSDSGRTSAAKSDSL